MATNAARLLRQVSQASCRCPAHGHVSSAQSTRCSAAKFSSPPSTKEYAFEMACSNIRYGEGVTSEVGLDFKNMKANRVGVVTDANLAKLPPMMTAVESLQKHGIEFQVFDRVCVEPTDASLKEAIHFAVNGNFDAYLAVGGGSVMDTCKAANLYASCPTSWDFLDYVNAPVGKGRPVTHTVRPLIAVPTTAGTGSETTGVAIFDYTPLKAKTGIASRALKPTLGIVDPLHVMHMPTRVAANSGFDVLCHALESYTALPYSERTPRPDNPINRPAYQGSNPISDVWSLHALRIVAKYMKRAVYDPSDVEARRSMHLASCFAGIGFGNAGVHLCHGMSYAISGNVRSYTSEGYDRGHPLIPHGLSVVVTAPAVFSFTGAMCPERHLEAAAILGADVTSAARADAGRILSDALRCFCHDLGVEDGLSALGYAISDIPALVAGTLPQKRVTSLSPRQQTEEDLAGLFEKSMKLY